MSASILQPVHQLRSQLRRVAVVRGLARLVTVVVGLMIVIGGLDWFFHWDDRTLRVSAAVGILLIGLRSAWIGVLSPLLTRVSDLEMAQRIESACPEFDGRLSSSVDFLDSPPEGSAVLTRRTISRASGQLETYSLVELIDRRPQRHSLVTALSVCALGVLLFGLGPVEARTALRRMTQPMADNPWPRETDLAVVDEIGRTLPDDQALRLIRGGLQEVLVINRRGDLPEDAVVEYRIGSRGEPRFETLQPVQLDPETERAAGRVVLSPPKGPVYFRAVGGDHQTEWYRLDVLVPPRVRRVNITVLPPQYLGKPAKQLASGATTIEAVAGSAVRLTIDVSAALRTAELVVGDQRVPMQLNSARTAAAAEFTLNRAGVFSWWTELTDAAGTRNPRPARYEVRVRPDTPPDVYIERPAEDLTATADALIPLRVTATDDHAVSTLRLDWSRNGDSPDSRTTLPLTLTTRESETTGVTRWSPVDAGLNAGDRITLTATAIDARPHTTVSTPRTIAIVTTPEKTAQLAEFQADLLGELHQAIRTQIEARDKLDDLRIQSQRAANIFRRSDVDLIRRIEAEQQRIGSMLFDPDDGIEARALALQEALSLNRIEPDESHARLSQLIDELGYVRESVDPEVTGVINRLRKEMEDAFEAQADTATVGGADQPIEAAARLQDEIINGFDSFLKETRAWKQTVDLRAVLSAIRAAQDRVTAKSARFAAQQLNNPGQAGQAAADAARLAKQQQRVADQFEDFLDRLRESRTNADPEAATRMAAVESLAAETVPGARMREAAEELDQGRVGAAAALQTQVGRALEQLEELLTGPAVSRTDVAIDELSQAELELRDRLQRQQAIAEGISEESDVRSLAGGQRELVDATHRTGRRLSRASAIRAGKIAASAAEEMKHAEQALREGRREPAARHAAAAKEQLRQAVEAVRGRKEQLQQQVARREIADALADVKTLMNGQTELIARTANADRERRKTGRLSRRLAARVLEIAAAQTDLAESAIACAVAADDVSVIALAVQLAGDEMKRAAGRLENRETGTETRAHQQAALEQLKRVVGVFGDRPSETAVEGSGNQTDPEPAQPAEQPAVPLIARLRLLCELQQWLNQQTQSLHGQAESPVRSAALEKLQQSQARLTGIAETLADELEKAR